MSDLSQLVKEIVAFHEAHGLARSHTPRNLAAALAIAVAEVQELMLWKTDEEVTALLAGQKRDRLEEELGDVLILALFLARQSGIDPARAVRRRLAKDAVKDFGVDSAARAMQIAGWAAAKTGPALEAAYGLGEEAVIAAMNAGGYAAGEIAGWLRTDRGKTLEEIVGAFQTGVPADRVVETLVSIYHRPAEFVFKVMAAAGYGFSEFADTMVAHFGSGIRDWLIEAALAAGVGLPEGFAVADIADWGIDVGGLTIDAVIALLERKGVPAGEVVDWLATRLSVETQDSLDEISSRLRGAGYTALEIASWLVDYGDEAVGKALKFSAYAVDDVADAISGAFTLGTEATARVLRKLGFTFANCVDWIEASLSRTVPATINAIVAVAKEAGFSVGDVARVMKSTRSVIARVMAAAMKASGYGKASVSKMLHDTYSLGAAAGAQVMALAGYDYLQIAGELLDEWGTGILGAAQILEDLGASYLQVLEVLSEVTQESADRIAAMIAGL